MSLISTGAHPSRLKMLLFSLTLLSNLLLLLLLPLSSCQQDSSLISNPTVRAALVQCGGINNVIDGRCPLRDNPPAPQNGPLRPAEKVIQCDSTERIVHAEVSAPFLPDKQRYGFTNGLFKMRLAFKSSRNITAMAASVPRMSRGPV